MGVSLHAHPTHCEKRAQIGPNLRYAKGSDVTTTSVAAARPLPLPNGREYHGALTYQASDAGQKILLPPALATTPVVHM